jgi:hypothetical protein
MNQNPLIVLAAEDRHTECCTNQFCRACGSPVSTYNANQSVVVQRPEASEWDWWTACDNADCLNAYGEGEFQGKPDWVVEGKLAP